MTVLGYAGGGAVAALMMAIAIPAAAQSPLVLEAELSTQYQPLRLVQVAGGLEKPWAVAFLSDGGYLVSERGGTLYRISEGERTAVSGLPEIHAFRQGGLLDVVPHPEHASNGWIYFTYSRGDSGGTVPALARARLEGDRLIDLEHLFESNTRTEPGRHYGSRILFLGDGTLLMTIGDRGATPARAQDTRDHSGSVVRLNADGSVPTDNPFVGNDTHASEIYSYGHRNIQGIALHPESGDIWATEHGPRGGDKLIRIRAGDNHGWPVVSRGLEYGTQEQFGEGRSAPGFVEPAHEFLPTIAPSGLAIVTDPAFHGTWRGNLLAGGLGAERLLRLVVDGGVVLHAEELLLGRIGRIRDVRQAPSGAIYVLTDEDDGGLFRLEPLAESDRS